jgi:hypothetical protein
MSSVYSKVTSRYVCRDKIIYQQIKEEYLTFWHRSFTFNSNKSPTKCNNFPVYFLTYIYSSTCFERFLAHHQELNECSGSLCFYRWSVLIVVLCRRSGWPARPRTQHDYHHDTKVKPEAATAFIELLMMGEKTPKTC